MARKPRHAAGGDHHNHEQMTDTIRREIVMRLAMYDGPVEIQADLADRGIDVSRQAIHHYIPAANGRPLAKKWVDLFQVTRAAFLEETASEPIANRTYRLRRLGIIHDRAMKRGDYARAQSALEQAAKEVGNVFTNVTNLKGSLRAAPIGDNMTTEEKRNVLADRLAEALATVKKPARTDATKH
jgi:hypothetical protein